MDQGKFLACARNEKDDEDNDDETRFSRVAFGCECFICCTKVLALVYRLVRYAHGKVVWSSNQPALMFKLHTLDIPRSWRPPHEKCGGVYKTEPNIIC